MKADHTTLFPDVAANHWAYEAVSDLSRRGLVEGYPDGTFGGDRLLTRYEFAQIVYRAIQDGVTVEIASLLNSAQKWHCSVWTQ